MILIGAMGWRISYLSDQNAIYKTNEKTYKATIKDLRESNALSEALSLQDRDDSVRNEIDRAEVIGDINAAEDSNGCGGVVRDTIIRLRNSISSGSN